MIPLPHVAYFYLSWQSHLSLSLPPTETPLSLCLSYKPTVSRPLFLKWFCISLTLFCGFYGCEISPTELLSSIFYVITRFLPAVKDAFIFILFMGCLMPLTTMFVIYSTRTRCLFTFDMLVLLWVVYYMTPCHRFSTYNHFITFFSVQNLSRFTLV